MLDRSTVTSIAHRLIEASTAERKRLDDIHDAVRDRAQWLYVPKKASQEYRDLIEQSRFNVLRLVIGQLAQALYVDGHRPSTGTENSSTWDAVWQANGMDARQAGLYRSAIEYGYSYALVVPGRPAPVITPLSPRRCIASYEDMVSDQWPEYALVFHGRKAFLWDEEAAYALAKDKDSREWVATGEYRRHGLGVVPLVRFLDSVADLDDGPTGKVEPLLPVQAQLNQLTFGLLMAAQFAAFKQKWVTGMAIAEDASGNPIEPFNAAVDRLFQGESPDTKFGEFSETDLSGYLNARDKALLYVSSVAQIPPHNLIVGAGISNISAEALAALEAGHRQDVTEHQTSFGESAEQMLRLAALAMGDQAAWEDTSGQVVWRDTTPRSIAQIADALGKMATLLEIPPRALWERIPGVTDTDLRRWEAMAAEDDLTGRLAEMLESGEPAAPVEEPDGAR
ncbi:phage portal protein [Salininema proteolyticum]|uniref:Phage portal protein n=1 Tax=Salininema proteolyticum TaxID=1607685 RepID=A0ABV8TWN4_9ACTN